MKSNHYKYSLLVFAGAAVMGSCRVTDKYKTPDVHADKLYRDTLNVADTTSMALMPWRSLFNDPILAGLIQEGIDSNLNLQNAILQIAEAQATLKQAKLAFLPTVSGGAKVTRAKQSQAGLNFPQEFLQSFNLTTTTYQASLSASWEFNVWGQLSSLKRQALAKFLESDASRKAVQTQLVADIANNYYQLLALDQQLRVTQETVKNRIDDMEAMKVLKENAVVNGAAVVQSEANRYSAEISIPDLKQSIRETENALCILLGRSPGPVKRGTLADQKPVEQLRVGVSTQLLRNRPDVVQAEMAFRSSFENVNVARSYFYPSISITADGGVSSLKLKDFFEKSLFYTLVGGVTQPIFNQGQNKARYRIAQAQKVEALNSYQQAILKAGQEVSNALYDYENAMEKQQLRVRQIVALNKSVDFTKELLRYSSATNYTDVLTSEQSLLSAQLSSISDKLEQLQAIVTLYRALGGGWQ